LQRVGAHFKQFLRNKLVEHKQYICEHGDDLPEIGDWKWPGHEDPCTQFGFQQSEELPLRHRKDPSGTSACSSLGRQDRMGRQSCRHPGAELSAELSGRTSGRSRRGCASLGCYRPTAHTYEGCETLQTRKGRIPQPWSACLVLGFRVSQISGEPRRPLISSIWMQ
jgi:hypothetical protein